MLATIFGEKTQVVFAEYGINGNTALEFCEPDDKYEYMVTASSNTAVSLPPELIGVKTWSENTGIVDELIREGLIIDEEITSIPTGRVMMPVYKLTEKANQERLKQLKENAAEMAEYEAMEKAALDKKHNGED